MIVNSPTAPVLPLFALWGLGSGLPCSALWAGVSSFRDVSSHFCTLTSQMRATLTSLMVPSFTSGCLTTLCSLIPPDGPFICLSNLALQTLAPTKLFVEWLLEYMQGYQDKEEAMFKFFYYFLINPVLYAV